MSDKPKRALKDERITIRVKSDEKEVWQMAAIMEDLSLSNFIIEAVRFYIETAEFRE